MFISQINVHTRQHYSAGMILTPCSALTASSVDIYPMLLSTHNHVHIKFTAHSLNALLVFVNLPAYKVSVARNIFNFSLLSDETEATPRCSFVSLAGTFIERDISEIKCSPLYTLLCPPPPPQQLPLLFV